MNGDHCEYRVIRTVLQGPVGGKKVKLVVQTSLGHKALTKNELRYSFNRKMEFCPKRNKQNTKDGKPPILA